ncbi:MAG: PKD domain-containing protein [Opitutales bacterium]|nr:PKD domain-containing protein [Opitutales bacterium]
MKIPPRLSFLANRMALLVGTVAALATAPAISAQTRGLWVDADRVAELRLAVQVTDTHHARAFAAMTNEIEAGHRNIIDQPTRLGDNWNYARSYLAQQAALAALLSTDPSDQTHFADIAFDALWAVYNDPDSGQNLPWGGSNSHLSKSTVAMGFAVGYEFAADLWTPTQRDWVRGKLIETLDNYPSLSHTNFGSPFSSNHLGVSRGAEMIMMLATGEEANRPVRYRFLRTQLLNHLNTHGNLGWGQEGNFYTGFSSIFTLPAKIAATRMGDPAMRLNQSGKQHHLVFFYSAVGSLDFDTVNWGVGGAQYDGGHAALSMAIAPEGEKGLARWWFDHFMGVQNPAPDAQKFDRFRQGRIWSILFYPEDVPALDPTDRYPIGIEDDGGFWMRRHWDTDAVVAYLGTDTKTYSRGWNAFEALSIVVLGHGNRYITGAGGSAYTGTAARNSFSTIIIDDTLPSNTSTGQRVDLRTGEDGAYAIASGGAGYLGIGAQKAHRHLVSDFSGNSGENTLLTIFDQLRSSGGSREYRWQINTGAATAILDTADGRPGFTLSYPGRDGYLRGWVVHPANANLQLEGSRLFFNTNAVDTDIWVVMALDEGTPPVPTITGSGTAATFSLNGTEITYNGASERILNSNLTLEAPPSASFTVSAPSGPAPHSVTVNAAASTSVSPISEYKWDFGDGTTATGSTATHTYTTEGVYSVSLAITTASGNRAFTERTVVAGYRYPTGSFTVSPSSGQPPLEVTINPSATNHPDGLPLTYEWDLGDGTTFTATDNASFTHTYPSGNYTLRLIVRDDLGGFDAAERTVTSANRAPQAVMSFTSGGGSAPLTVRFTGDESSDPDGDPITFLWNFGDGHTSTETNPEHIFTTPGDYTVTLTVTDTFGLSHSTSTASPISVRDLSDIRPAIDPAALPTLLRGLAYTQRDRAGSGSAAFFTPELLPLVQAGVLRNFHIWNRAYLENLGYHFSGYIDVPEDGVYTFYMTSGPGGGLSVAGEEHHRITSSFGNFRRWKSVALSAGLHRIEGIHIYVDQFAGGIPIFEITWSGPGFERHAIDPDTLYHVPSNLVADFVFSPAPGSTGTNVLHSFDAATSAAFDGEEIVDYEWTFPGGVTKSGRFVQHAFGSGSHNVLLAVTTNTGARATIAKVVTVQAPEPYVGEGIIDRSVMPGRIARARSEFGDATADRAFDGDKTSRWLDVGTLVSWIEVEFQNNGVPTPYVISEYRFTSLTLWNARDPFSWRLLASNDGVNWTVLDEVTGNAFPPTSHPRTVSFPLPDNTTAYSFYRFEDMVATGTSNAPDAVGLNLIELLDHGTGNQPPSSPPVIALSVSDSAPAVGQVVSFDASASSHPEGYPLHYAWDFGDGRGAEGWELAQVNHTYYSTGEATVTLTVTEALGKSATTTRTVSSSIVPNANPVAHYTYSKSAPYGWTTLTFDASGSFDPDGDPITYHWEFGDGTSATGPTAVHALGVGKYTPTLTVTDDRGGRSTFATEIVIAPPPNQPASIGLNFFGSRDERFDFLQPNEIAGYVPQAFWNHMGTTRTAAIPYADPADGFLDSSGQPSGLLVTRLNTTGLTNSHVNATTPRTPDHRLMRAGFGGTLLIEEVPYAEYDVYVYLSTYLSETHPTMSLTLTTSAGTEVRGFRHDGSAWSGQYVESFATSPEAATVGGNFVVFRGLTDRSFTLSSNSPSRRRLANAIQIVAGDDSPVARPVYVQTPENTPIDIDVLALALGNEVSLQSWTAPEQGTLAALPNGHLRYTPPAGFNGMDLFQFTIVDNEGRTSASFVQVQVGVPPVPPTAVDDSGSLVQGGSLTLDVLANDSHPNELPFSIVSLTQPTHGTAVITADQRITYTPAAAFSGNDSFTYRIEDIDGNWAIGLVNISVLPVSQSDAISVNFRGSRVLPSNASAGFIPRAYWNNAQGGETILTGSDGLITGARVTTNAGNAYTATLGGDSADHLMMSEHRGRLANQTDYAFEGIPYEEYDVYVYYGAFVRDEGLPHFAKFTIGEETYWIRHDTLVWDGHFTRSTATTMADAAHSSYVVFEGLTGSAFTLISDSNTRRVGPSGIQIIKRTTTDPVDAYDAWLADHDLSGNPDTAPGASFLGDGVSNFLKFAAGRSPLETLPAAFLPTLESVFIGDGHHIGLRFRLRDDAPGLTWTVEESPDLLDWTPATLPYADALPHDDGTRTRFIRTTHPIGTDTDIRFLRLRLELDD